MFLAYKWHKIWAKNDHTVDQIGSLGVQVPIVVSFQIRLGYLLLVVSK